MNKKTVFTLTKCVEDAFHECQFKCAFTLAEVLITLTIIGVVAALTIPALTAKWQNKALTTQQTVTEAKMTESFKQMNLHEDFAPHSNTESFVNKFQKYMKFANKCESSKITNCFTETITKSTGEEVKTETLTNSSKLGKEYTNNNMAFTLLDGTSFIFTYNPDCEAPDKYRSIISTTKCLGYVLDLNGAKKPNVVGQDIVLYNVSLPGGGCNGIEGAGLCIASADIEYTCNADPNTGDPNSCYSAANAACTAIGMHAPDTYESIVMNKNKDLFGNPANCISSMLDSGMITQENLDTFDKNNWDGGAQEDRDYVTSLYYGFAASTSDVKKIRCVQ